MNCPLWAHDHFALYKHVSVKEMLITVIQIQLKLYCSSLEFYVFVLVTKTLI